MNTRYKLNKGYIQNKGYCFKNTFLIIQNITYDIIPGTLFLKQIYPFQVNESGVHTKILGNQISFNFLSVAKQGKVSLLQNSSIYKQANLLQLKQNQISYLHNSLCRRLRKNLEPWSAIHTDIVRQIKQKVKSLPCLGIPHPSAFMIKETHESDTGYGGIHKQRTHDKEQLVHYHSGIWLGPQKNYSSIRREILSIVLCISKFQDGLFNKKVLLRIDC